MGFFTGCARILLIAFNFIFWLSGAAILGVGIWILVDPNLTDYLDVIHDATDNDEFLKVAAYILIGFGSFIFLVGFCGCCGAIRSSKCLIGMYIFFLIVICAGELAAGIYVAVSRGDFEDKLDKGLKKSIVEHYKEPLGGAWDVVQKELKCCGGLSYTDYANSTWKQSVNVQIPLSCCKLNDKGSPVNPSGCQNLTSDYYNEGCKDALIDWMDDHSTTIIGVGCGIAALEIIGLLCAICFCRHMDKEDKYTSN